jgi:hypothetical protein
MPTRRDKSCRRASEKCQHRACARGATRPSRRRRSASGTALRRAWRPGATRPCSTSRRPRRSGRRRRALGCGVGCVGLFGRGGRRGAVRARCWVAVDEEGVVLKVQRAHTHHAVLPAARIHVAVGEAARLVLGGRGRAGRWRGRVHRVLGVGRTEEEGGGSLLIRGARALLSRARVSEGLPASSAWSLGPPTPAPPACSGPDPLASAARALRALLLFLCPWLLARVARERVKRSVLCVSLFDQ